MYNRYVRGVAADDPGRQPACLLELGVFILAACWYFQEPVQMQLWFNLIGFGVGPLPAAFHHYGRRTEQLFQLFPCCLWVCVTFGAQDRPFGQVSFSRLLVVSE